MIIRDLAPMQKQISDEFRDLPAEQYPEVFRRELCSAPTIQELRDHHRCNVCGRMFFDVVLNRDGHCDICVKERQRVRDEGLVHPRWSMLNDIHPLAVPNIVHIASFVEKLITSRIRCMIWIFRNRGLGRSIRSCGAGFLADHFRVLR